MELTKLNNATSNLFLIDFLNRFEWKHFIGVFSSNSIPPNLHQERDFTIICNLSRLGEPGTHFISIIKRGNSLMYLDPLAMYITLNNDLTNFIESCNCENILKFIHPIQDPTSWYCGYFSLYFSLYFNETLPYHNELTPFDVNNLKLNDCICLHNLMILYNKIL